MQKDEIRERLVELFIEADKFNKEICDSFGPCGACPYAQFRDCAPRVFADYFIAHGVTLATDTNVGSKWISVEERIPDIYDKDPNWSQTVLFRTAHGHIHSGYRNIGRAQTSFYDDDWTPPYWLDESEDLSFEENEVTHWMPLP